MSSESTLADGSGGLAASLARAIGDHANTEQAAVLTKRPGNGANRIPREARDGLMRAWIEILREQHPGVTWIAVDSDTEATR